MFCWVVYLLVLAFEPLIDCIFLANGQKEHLIKTQLYLTPSGIVPLVSHAINLVPAVKNMFKAADIKDEFNSSLGEAAGGTPGDDGSFGTDLNGYVNMDYTDHLMILILFRVEQQTQLKRIQNIIQMEGKTYYQELKNKDFEFRLENAGTHLNTTVNYSLNPLFNVDGLTAEGGAYSVVSTVKNTY